MADVLSSFQLIKAEIRVSVSAGCDGDWTDIREVQRRAVVESDLSALKFNCLAGIHGDRYHHHVSSSGCQRDGADTTGNA